MHRQTDHRDIPGTGTHPRGRFDRATLLKVACGGAAALALPRAAMADSSGTSFGYFPQVQGTYSPESVEQIVGNILTWAHFEVTAATFILDTPQLVSSLGLTGLPLAFLQAFTVELQSHLDFWSGLVPSASPETRTFTIDPSLVPGPAQALAVFEVAATIRIGMMVAATREFAELGQPTLAKYSAQTLGMYAEERAIARTLQALAGAATASPPNNKAFETDLFLYTREAVAALHALGFIGGKGVTLTYPGRDAALAAGGAAGARVIQRVPNSATSPLSITGLGSFLQPRS